MCVDHSLPLCEAPDPFVVSTPHFTHTYINTLHTCTCTCICTHAHALYVRRVQELYMYMYIHVCEVSSSACDDDECEV